MKDQGAFPMLTMEARGIGPSVVLVASGVSGGRLEGQRLLLLRTLSDNSNGATGLTYSTWEKISALKESSFNKAREWLRAAGYVVSDAGKWKITDAGRRALAAVNSTDSTATTPIQNGPPVHATPPRWGSLQTPAVELDAAGSER